MLSERYQAIVIGGSAGSIEVLLQIFANLPEKIGLPIIIVCHLHPLDDGGLVDFFSKQTAISVKEAADKEQIRSGHIYLPPADYHLLVESDRTFSLSVDPKVNYSRPSIDVFFESAAMAWADELIGIILTGASTDGSAGIQAIQKYGGLTIAQDPADAAYPVMPKAAIECGGVDKIFSVKDICRFMQKVSAGRDQVSLP